MTKVFIASVVSAAFIVSAQPLFAQKGHGSKPAGPTTAHGASSHGGASGGSGHGLKPATPTHTSKATPQTHASTPKTSAHGSKPTVSTHGSKATTTPASKPSKPSHADKHTTTTAPPASTTSTSSPTGRTLTPVQQKLQKNTQLAAKVQSRLPAGRDVMAASEGFKNLGQFVAAVNVSHNLGIPFEQLKTSMVDEGSSLGQSIQTLKRSANSELEVERAEREANTMISGSEAVSTSTTKSKKQTTFGVTTGARE